VVLVSFAQSQELPWANRTFGTDTSTARLAMAEGPVENSVEGAKMSIRHSGGAIRFASGFVTGPYSGDAVEAAVG
jgi:hypothetical protein